MRHRNCHGTVQHLAKGGDYFGDQIFSTKFKQCIFTNMGAYFRKFNLRLFAKVSLPRTSNRSNHSEGVR